MTYLSLISLSPHPCSSSLSFPRSPSFPRLSISLSLFSLSFCPCLSPSLLSLPLFSLSLCLSFPPSVRKISIFMSPLIPIVTHTHTHTPTYTHTLSLTHCVCHLCPS